MQAAAALGQDKKGCWRISTMLMPKATSSQCWLQGTAALFFAGLLLFPPWHLILSVPYSARPLDLTANPS